MKRREGMYNPNRRIANANAHSPAARDDLALRVSYGGNPEHKRNPADYGLGPPPNPRPSKTLCDADGPLGKAEATDLLKAGVRKGMISQQTRGEWPQNVWSVSKNGVPYEAQLENRVQGIYHGYPMATDDDFRKAVLKEWPER